MRLPAATAVMSLVEVRTIESFSEDDGDGDDGGGGGDDDGGEGGSGRQSVTTSVSS